MPTEVRPMRSEPASRTITFLFTDIEAGTRLWKVHEQSMKEALERHDAIVRGAVGGFRGHVVKTIGDGFTAVFDSAVDAVFDDAAAVGMRAPGPRAKFIEGFATPDPMEAASLLYERR
jgi:class 3 adenylate cyclase